MTEQTSQKEQVRAKINKLRAEMDEIESREREELWRGRVGKCYRFRNNYSMPESPSDYWWLYTQVTGFEEGEPQFVRFQIDKNGKAEVERELVGSWRSMSGYEEIEPEELDAAWSDFVAHVISQRAALSNLNGGEK